MNIFLLAVLCYLAIGVLLPTDYLIRISLFNKKTGAKWSEYQGLFAQCLDMAILWPKWMAFNLSSHYSVKED